MEIDVEIRLDLVGADAFVVSIYSDLVGGEEIRASEGVGEGVAEGEGELGFEVGIELVVEGEREVVIKGIAILTCNRKQVKKKARAND